MSHLCRAVVAPGLLLLVVSGAAAQDIPLSDILLPGEGWQQVKGVSGALGAIISDTKGNVYVAVDKRILRLGTSGEAHDFAVAAGQVGGLAFSEGTLYATVPSKQQIVRYDDKGKEEVIHDKIMARDIAVYSGRIYYTSPAKKAVFLLGHSEPVAAGLGDPSGLVFWRKGGTLVVGDALGRHLYAFRIKRDGALDARERYYALFVRKKQPSEVRGLTIDSKGLVYAATKEGVQVFDPTGRLSGVMVRPRRAAVTGVAFGGKERRLLYIVCDGKLWQRKTKARGAP